MKKRGLVLGLVLVVAGCRSPRDERDGGPEDGGSGDAGEMVDGGSAARADIRSALSCANPAGVGGGGTAGHLQIHEVDTTMFPDALCNDGTGAVLYYRPYAGDANRDRWVISLRGGGSCGNAENCAARWCGCEAPRGGASDRCPFTDIETNFNANNMSGGGAGSIAGGGVMRRHPDYPTSLAGYNHVQLVYCSSDTWQGNARGVTFTTAHPITGEEVTYTMHFLGARILDADLRILRQDGVAPLAYTLDGGSEPMPDLDDAIEVVMVGDSGGGAGVITNVDYIAEMLRDHNTRGSGAPEVVGVIDAIVAPDLSRLEWDAVGAGASYAAFVNAAFTAPANAGARYDASCLEHHAETGTEAECADNMHVIRHHVTTPFFVRMALKDALLSRTYYEAGLADPVLGAFDADANVFATVLHAELTAFPALSSSAEEGDAIDVAPGVFAPSCRNHDTIHEDTEVFGVSIAPDPAMPDVAHYFFDVFDAWRGDGAGPTAVLSSDPTTMQGTVCPP